MGTPNWNNQTIWTGDCLDVMRGLNSESVDLIYLDPPFNSNADYAAPIGSKAAGAAFKDTWGLDDINLAWHGLIKSDYPALYDLLGAVQKVSDDSMMSYLIYMSVRVMEMRRVLKETGTLYLHCNQHAGHYLKLMLDSLFREKNFMTEVVWDYGTPSGGRTSGKKPVKTHDTLLVYAKRYSKHLYNIQYTPYSEKYVNDWFRHEDEDGRAYRTRSRKGEIKKQYLDESPGVPLSTVWHDIMQLSSRTGWYGVQKNEIQGYPTQKPLALLLRVIELSSKKGDMVLDPFCGCATACIAAEQQGRQWAGIDISPKAADLVESRMEAELGLFYQGTPRTDTPSRTDLGAIPKYNSPPNKNYLYGEQGGYCNGCGTHFEKRHLEIDHIIPTSKGGTDHISNLQLLCGSCNRMKGNRPQEELLAKLTDKGWVKENQPVLLDG